MRSVNWWWLLWAFAFAELGCLLGNTSLMALMTSGTYGNVDKSLLLRVHIWGAVALWAIGIACQLFWYFGCAMLDADKVEVTVLTWLVSRVRARVRGLLLRGAEGARTGDKWAERGAGTWCPERRRHRKSPLPPPRRRG